MAKYHIPEPFLLTIDNVANVTPPAKRTPASHAPSISESELLEKCH